jgi:hypothetical protein
MTVDVLLREARCSLMASLGACRPRDDTSALDGSAVTPTGELRLPSPFAWSKTHDARGDGGVDQIQLGLVVEIGMHHDEGEQRMHALERGGQGLDVRIVDGAVDDVSDIGSLLWIDQPRSK